MVVLGEEGGGPHLLAHHFLIIVVVVVVVVVVVICPPPTGVDLLLGMIMREGEKVTVLGQAVPHTMMKPLTLPATSREQQRGISLKME